MSIHDVLSGGFWAWLLGEARFHLSGTNGLMILTFWGVFAFAVVLTYLRSPGPHSPRGLLAHMLPSTTLRHPSARADLLFWLSRRIFMPLLVLPTALSTVAAGHAAYSLLGHVVGIPQQVPGPLTSWQLVAF